ncbi:MAG: hypothetical protein K6G03_04550 [Lachnospiraceae bacterium]|nr:hypothetical protein [Lachnospiraceae bacterium]
MKKGFGDIAIIAAIIVIIGILIFMKRESIMEALHIEPSNKADASEAATEETEEVTAKNGDENAAESSVSGAEAPTVESSMQVQNSLKVKDPLLAANNVKDSGEPATIPEAGLIENNIIGSSWESLKENYSYTDFEAEEDDIAQLRFLNDGSVKYYQSPGSGEIFGVADDKIVAYLKRWNGTPLNEALPGAGIFDIQPYIYQATDHLNFYEWKIANCYVGLLVEDTGDGVEENAPLYAESYVLQRRLNSFYK